jgi:pimeloyl-ACP methyl ester carboxylesterase
MICTVSKGKIHYEIVGEGHPVLILHAMGTDHRSMMAWVEPIFNKRTGFQRIYADLPAHGKSEIFADMKSSDDMVQNLLELIDSLLPEQSFSLIGTSFGGYLAQGILHNRPHQVTGICLLSPALHMKNRVQPEKTMIVRDENLLTQLDPDIRAAFETLMIYQDKGHLEYFLQEIQPGRLMADREFLLSDWREKGYFFSEELFGNVDRVNQPALILTGKQDSICNYRDSFVLLEKFSCASFVVLDQAGHMLQIEKRELVQGLVVEWLNRILETAD